MKFLVITAVAAYKKDIIKILSSASVQSFSFTNVTGHHAPSGNMESNWFAGDQHEVASIMCYVFVDDVRAEKVFEAVNDFNAHKDTTSNIHMAKLSIEKSNEE
jgi:nitrogen regulatory protein PII